MIEYQFDEIIELQIKSRNVFNKEILATKSEIRLSLGI